MEFTTQPIGSVLHRSCLAVAHKDKTYVLEFNDYVKMCSLDTELVISRIKFKVQFKKKKVKLQMCNPIAKK